MTLPEYDMLLTDMKDITPSGHKRMPVAAAGKVAAAFRRLPWLEQLRRYEKNY